MTLPEPALLRVATAGSVDDGKSTLLGRLLHDAKGVFADQLEAVADATRRRGAADGEVDLALLTDGLRSEREQGITIDVAYRYFTTARRAFVLADTPGHVQYTRNMVTGASTADVALVLVDVRHGITEQSRRHVAVAALLGVPHVVLVVNKMDLVGWDKAVFERVVEQFRTFAARVGVSDGLAVPVSALHGDNVVHRSAAAPWYDGPALLEHLDAVTPHASRRPTGLRFPVQYVVREPGRDYRGYAGRVAGGAVRAGDEVVVLPSGVRTVVAAVDTYDGPVDAGAEGRSVVLRLADHVDAGRGDLLAAPADAPQPTRDVAATVCALAEQGLAPGRYVLKHTTRTTRAVLDQVTDVLDVPSGTLGPAAAPGLALNDIGRVRLRTAEPLALDDYVRNRRTGAFLLIDESSGATVAAGMAGPVPWAVPA
ncbi:MAG TPA: GTP-binding protein [Kineosporiaceae bacterium]|jgi:sulfate adenylyltransferase large subunit|nr:GTP-binding protein [Kineosporiaceae bacterium]